MTGGRIKRIKNHINNETFMITYGDGVGNIDIKSLFEFHKANGKACTVTSVQPSGRFGLLSIDENSSVQSFFEKPKGDGAWINGGYFVCEPSIFDYIEGDATIWEKEPMERIATDGQMKAFKHNGFWRPMDTLKDKMDLHEMWVAGKAPWKIW
jgi:glucose-1-phosphate cytidylyltransferase